MTRGYLIEPPRPGAAAVVIANGPSLRGVDLARFGAFATFGMNAAYRHWRRIGWAPDHYACLDEVVGLSHAEAIAAMVEDAGRHAGRAPRRFLLRRNLIDRLGPVGRAPQVVDFEALVEADPAALRGPVTTGSHTLIWAILCGFRTVFLIGADAVYTEVVPGAEPVEGDILEIRRRGENPNYFFDDYQAVGDRYHRPNIGGESHRRAWRVAAAVAAEREAEVYNLSPASHIEVFDFARLDDLLSGGPVAVTPAALHERPGG